MFAGWRRLGLGQGATSVTTGRHPKYAKRQFSKKAEHMSPQVLKTSPRAVEMQRLRQELLRRILMNEARRQDPRPLGAKSQGRI